ncbi:MAG: alpha-amylase family protein [Bryobacteraceae bacterium]
MIRRQWSRRALLRGAIAAPAVGMLGLRPAQAADLSVPDWIAPGKLRWVWALWEPMELYARGGGAAGIGDQRATGHWVRKWYDRMHSDEILEKLAAAGVNVVSTHFYKGFGLKAEAAEMARVADFTKRAHARGIRVLGYHQFSSVMYETMLDEVPNLADWIQRGPDGSMLTYSGAKWRWKACPIHDEFMAYLRRVMDRCLLEADMDGVEFDGTSYDCHCEKCQAAFRQYLTEHNPQPLERFGIPHFRHARIPLSFDKRDPLWQEWIRFRIDLMGRRLREMRAYVHQKKTGAALVTYGDGPMGWRSDRTRLLPDQGDYLDLAVAESHDMPQMLDGELVTKVPYLKDGTSLGRVVLSTDWLRTDKGGIKRPDDPKPVELDMAECLAGGAHVLTATWALRSGDKRDGSAFFEQPAFHEAMKSYMGFSRDHEDLYVGARPCANVWVYHSFASLAFDHARAYHSALGFERALLGRIAYRIAKQMHLPTLGPSDVLIVANQTCLSAEECRQMRAAVNRGCGLILTGRSSEYDENFRQYEKPALKDLWTSSRVRYFAKCPGITQQKTSTLRPAMPTAVGEILRAVTELARKGLAAELTGGDPRQPLTFVDVYRLPKGTVAHVVYYGDGKPEGLRLRVADWLATGKPVLYSPYLATPASLKSVDGWIDLPSIFGRYAAIRFA